MKIQVAMIASNSQDTIIECLDNWTNKVDRIFIMTNNCTDNTVALVNNYGKDVVCVDRPFEGFAKTRNTCLDLCYDPSYDFTVVIDDSYLLVGDIRKELKKYKKFDCLGINIKNSDSGIKYLSARIIKTAKKHIRFVNPIHEVLNAPIQAVLTDCFIVDKVVPEHIERTLKRNVSDIEILRSGPETSRSLYFIALTVHNLYKGGCSYVSEQDVIESYLKRIYFEDDDAEEKFYCSINLGSFYDLLGEKDNAIRMFVQAAVLFTERAGEAYFFAYLITEQVSFLKFSYYHRKLGRCRLPVDENLYGENGVIEREFKIRCP